jgi:hypothetical protein
MKRFYSICRMEYESGFATHETLREAVISCIGALDLERDGLELIGQDVECGEIRTLFSANKATDGYALGASPPRIRRHARASRRRMGAE